MEVKSIKNMSSTNLCTDVGATALYILVKNIHSIIIARAIPVTTHLLFTGHTKNEPKMYVSIKLEHGFNKEDKGTHEIGIYRYLHGSKF